MASSTSPRFSMFSGGADPGSGKSRIGRWFAIGGAILLMLLLLPNMFTYVNPGFVGIIVHRTGGGVDKTPLGPGLHARNPLTTGIFEYPVYMQTLVLAKSPQEGSATNDEININSREGQPLSVDISMSFELDPAMAPKLYETFRQDIRTIQHGYVKNAIRQSLQEVVGDEAIADMLGPKKAEVVDRTRTSVQKALIQYGINVRQFTLNEVRAPASVMEAIGQKNVMQQQALTAQNELQKKQFQATGDSIAAMGKAKAILGEAEAQAKANILLSQSITANLVQYEMAKRWDGKMPQVSGSAMPLLQLNKP